MVFVALNLRSAVCIINGSASIRVRLRTLRVVVFCTRVYRLQVQHHGGRIVFSSVALNLCSTVCISYRLARYACDSVVCTVCGGDGADVGPDKDDDGFVEVTATDDCDVANRVDDIDPSQ